MRKAFTLIELLVVIAIIAILAAILFPVFAQAKVAAKKSSAISNAKQIGAAILMYSGDYDDTYPRNDGCEQGSSLNPNLRGTSGGCGSGRYHNKLDHYSWQKWVMPYIKNLGILEHPGRDKINVGGANGCESGPCWDNNGQIMGGFVLNTAITGQLASASGLFTEARAFRNSWTGGTQTALARVADTALVIEFGNPIVNNVPAAILTSATQNSVTVYPPAWRNMWKRQFMRWTACGGIADEGGYVGNNPDPRNVFGDGIVCSMADGSARFFNASRFVAQTPRHQDYGTTPSTNGCGLGRERNLMQAGDRNFINYTGTPRTDIDFGLWGLGGQN